MNNKLKNLTIAGLIFGIIASFIFHFMYEFLNNNVIVGLFTPINESVWEHGKLLVFPFLFYSIFEYFFLKPNSAKNYFAIKFFIMIATTLLLPVLFYTYSGILGYNLLVVDILIAVVLVLLSYVLSYIFINNDYNFKQAHIINGLGATLILLFFIFTFYPPNISWFMQ
jgi:hypothetical protein